MNEDQAKQIIRRLESIEKTQNMMYKDRDVMEDTHIRVGTMIDEIRMLKERVAKLEKNLLAEVQDMKDEVVETKDLIGG